MKHTSYKNPYSIEKKTLHKKGFDYHTDLPLFITMVVNNRKNLFGNVFNGNLVINEAGKMIENTFIEIEKQFHDEVCINYAVMPNHFHCIIQNTVYGENCLFDIMKWFKGTTTIKYINGVKECGWMPFDKQLWQTRYYDEIVWNEKYYKLYSDYITMNPIRWTEDKLNLNCGNIIDNINERKKQLDIERLESQHI